jgi:hypothetical protein
MCNPRQHLIETLTAERYQPLPPRPRVPDGPTAVLMRWEALEDLPDDDEHPALELVHDDRRSA